MAKGPVPHALVGEVFSEGLPRGREAAYGHVTMEPSGSFEIRSHQTFKIIYTCGPYGLDDTGAIRITFRFTRDGGPLQTTDAKSQNYVTATTTGQAKLQLEYRAHGPCAPALAKPDDQGLRRLWRW